MEKIRVELAERSYDIAIGSNVLEGVGDNLKSFGLSPKIALVSNPTVFSLYGERVSVSVKKAGFDILTVIIPDGEEYKDLLWVQHIYNELLKAKLDRSSALIALGGGVIGDITGFAASTYMRGISYIQMPTTLLAQVDSSVGGKTGVNHKLGKNMIGVFWQPRLVWIDVGTLKTLPKRELLAGIAEVIKYGIIHDKELFDFLEVNRDKILNLDRGALTHVIKRSCEIKAEVVSKDERESGLRAILNYGHTIGHAIETVTKYKRFLHGEALAIGIYLEARLSQMLNFIKRDQVFKIKNLIDSYGLPSEMPADIDINSILSSIQLDKKVVAGELKFILPEKIGSVRIYKGMTEKEIRQVLQS
ncbi:MAG: 3-dehydroquinate synthase [Nitrospirae bacterium CG_4_10_14_0_8_um_filter_41_23]|nr:MAG: 3-dehydroquinate synthase [Nitrospirae bacterium CG2_30_41_42]PIQ93502.1 MAG: 3-dehydroquinate synthase [Nitrospirae bacterium CG11_big_fil_rev_8_21_14_0_20_41_14]PIV43442.1 MAG: 3-dehydroquinate synthase [Nitrospirae bacterium CG02_land_8_20_14_3_00_41_53]PIW87918.1 MAG: 3-dehydroquinate synthase [Nitrospirae bacterium CG_4_8_14_3_um_filter_41_47]PIY87068.1 MAG: 3-dehydroquinate synthase [Nitrospirae bacterium CG_4_10_14_0_8_um_filter_41_23]PJA79074.1 MAG: 3-dehydroquinate synthase [N